MVPYALVKPTLEWLFLIRSTWFFGKFWIFLFKKQNKLKQYGITFNLCDKENAKTILFWQTSTQIELLNTQWKHELNPFFPSTNSTSVLSVLWWNCAVFLLTFKQCMLRVFVFCCQLYVVPFGVRSMPHAHSNGPTVCSIFRTTFRIPVHWYVYERFFYSKIRNEQFECFGSIFLNLCEK